MSGDLWVLLLSVESAPLGLVEDGGRLAAAPTAYPKVRLILCRARCPHRAVPGRPGVPPEMRESSSLAVGADDLGGPRAHTVRPYGGKRPGSAGSEAADAKVESHQSQFFFRSGPQLGRTERHPSTPGFSRRKDSSCSKG